MQATLWNTGACWLWRDTAPIPEKPEKDVGHGLVLPIYAAGPSSCGWWAMFITMLADVTAYLTLVFAFYYYVTINEGFDLSRLSVGSGWLFGGLVIAVACAGLALGLRRRGVGGASGAAILTAVALLAGVGGALLLWGASAAGFEPTSHALAATMWTLLGWSAVHMGLGAVMLLFCAAACLAGKLDARHRAFLWNTELYLLFTAFMVATSVLVVLLHPVVP
jgi:heme/copper-type cytochrome/quinol oxidase subunit 3